MSLDCGGNDVLDLAGGSFCPEVFTEGKRNDGGLGVCGGVVPFACRAKLCQTSISFAWWVLA